MKKLIALEKSWSWKTYLNFLLLRGIDSFWVPVFAVQCKCVTEGKRCLSFYSQKLVLASPWTAYRFHTAFTDMQDCVVGAYIFNIVYMVDITCWNKTLCFLLVVSSSPSSSSDLHLVDLFWHSRGHCELWTVCWMIFWIPCFYASVLCIDSLSAYDTFLVVFNQ